MGQSGVGLHGRENVDCWDSEYKWLEDNSIVSDLSKKYPGFKNLIKVCKLHKATGREHYESILELTSIYIIN